MTYWKTIGLLPHYTKCKQKPAKDTCVQEKYEHEGYRISGRMGCDHVINIDLGGDL